MAARKSECLDCEHVFLKKGQPVCPECESDNIASYAQTNDEYADDQPPLDEFEMRDFHARRTRDD